MIGAILKNARVKAELSQKELGDILSFARNTISSYERGNSQPDFETILKILNVCGYDVKIFEKNTNIEVFLSRIWFFFILVVVYRHFKGGFYERKIFSN